MFVSKLKITDNVWISGRYKAMQTDMICYHDF